MLISEKHFFFHGILEKIENSHPQSDSFSLLSIFVLMSFTHGSRPSYGLLLRWDTSLAFAELLLSDNVSTMIILKMAKTYQALTYCADHLTFTM